MSLLFLPLFWLSAAVPAVAGQHHDRHDPRVLAQDPATAEGPMAPKLNGLGELTHPVTTDSPAAQEFFDQGLRLTYGFNHHEALRSFQEAARLDPSCAMAYWGQALVLGPNLNLPMDPALANKAREAIDRALELSDGVSHREQAYIAAMARRYSADPAAERAELDQAYAQAMAELHLGQPADSDAATLYAAALMNLTPWNYWQPDGQPGSRTEELLGVLEGVLERDPRHIGALHYYIHAVEPVDPDRGIWAADQLRGLAPGAGHLVHMPSHIYMQVGRYAEALAVNRDAALADESYLTQCRNQGIYALGYYPHNLHFEAWAATMMGNSETALAAARKVAAQVPKAYVQPEGAAVDPELGDPHAGHGQASLATHSADQHNHGNDWGLYQSFLGMPLQILSRFGRWQEVLSEPEPPRHLVYWRGLWHYARGLAFVHQGRGRKAARELQQLNALAGDREALEELVGFASAGTLLTLAREVLSGELLASRGRFDQALGHLSRAVRLEDSLLYNEPPDWYTPVRHTLGAVLLEAGQPREAEIVYWQDLRRYRENGYSLYGLELSLAAQGRGAEAEELRQRRIAARAGADGALRSSRF